MSLRKIYSFFHSGLAGICISLAAFVLFIAALADAQPQTPPDRQETVAAVREDKGTEESAEAAEQEKDIMPVVLGNRQLFE
ncbi:MAG: hypothetical protein ACYTER_06670, partial [Planctomycetota bacterium]